MAAVPGGPRGDRFPPRRPDPPHRPPRGPRLAPRRRPRHCLIFRPRWKMTHAWANKPTHATPPPHTNWHKPELTDTHSIPICLSCLHFCTNKFAYALIFWVFKSVGLCVCFTQNTRFSGWRMFWQRLQLVTVSSDTILRHLFRLLFAWSALWRTAHTKNSDRMHVDCPCRSPGVPVGPGGRIVLHGGLATRGSQPSPQTPSPGEEPGEGGTVLWFQDSTMQSCLLPEAPPPRQNTRTSIMF